MRTPRIEVGDVLVQHPLEVALVENEQMIQTLGTRGSDPAFSERVRPRRVQGCPELSYPESSQAPIKRFAIPAVPVTEEIPRPPPILDLPGAFHTAWQKERTVDRLLAPYSDLCTILLDGLEAPLRGAERAQANFYPDFAVPKCLGVDRAAACG